MIGKPLELVDEILQPFATIMGNDYHAYRNHVYRLTRLCNELAEFNEEELEKIEIAACFHDIGIWTGPSLDYLPPSENQAIRYLTKINKESWIPEITQMITMHHAVRSCAGNQYKLVDLFRRADIADFSLGLFPMGIPRSRIAQIKKDIPNAGFHFMLLKRALAWFVKNPLNPAPMFKW